jgi:putative membrane protein
MTRSIGTAALIGATVSILASVLKGIGERSLQRAAESLWPPTEAQKELVGADPSGRPENMPPAVLADRVARWLGHAPLDDRSKIRAQKVIHYTFGAVFGAGYSIAAKLIPTVTTGMGVPAGAALYAVTHASVLPLLGIQEPPGRLPRSAVAWEFTSHLGFGLTLELGRRTASRLFVRGQLP